MNLQCNTCGSFNDIIPCTHCQISICASCKTHHEGLCENLQKSKRRGEGPTIANVPVPEHRAGHIAPIAGPADRPSRNLLMPAALGAPYDLSKPSLDPEEFFHQMIAMPSAEPVPEPLTIDIPAMKEMMVSGVGSTTQGILPTDVGDLSEVLGPAEPGAEQDSPENK